MSVFFMPLFVPILSFALPTSISPYLHLHPLTGSTANANYSQNANPSRFQPLNAFDTPLPSNTSSPGIPEGWQLIQTDPSLIACPIR